MAAGRGVQTHAMRGRRILPRIIPTAEQKSRRIVLLPFREGDAASALSLRSVQCKVIALQTASQE
jgi:hypothetical protein